MCLDSTTETLYALNMKKTSSSVSREARQPDFLWFSVIKTGAILLDGQRLLCFWAQLHSMVAFWLPRPGDTQRGPASCFTAFPREAMWGLGEEFTPASPTTGWASIRTPAYTSVVQQEDLGVYVVTCLKTLVFNNLSVFTTTAFRPVKAIRSLSCTWNLYFCGVCKDSIVRNYLSNLTETGHLCKIALGIYVRGIKKTSLPDGACIWRLLVKAKILNFTELNT